ncbi:TPA: ABC transporter substrate-binding protein [Vibrio vulnificus]|nr:ABC transporter substrate-binding protein [Vibrio vulnificus]
MNKFLFGVLSISFSVIANAGEYPVKIMSCDKEVIFNEPPKRAVIHDLNMAEMAFSLNLQDHIVGLSGISGWYKMTPEFKKKMGDIPELAPKYPSMEVLLASAPDFFFAGWNYGMTVDGDVTPEKLKKYGINTFVLSESCAIAGTIKKKASMNLLYDDVLTLGKIFDKEADAEKLVTVWKKRLSDVPKPSENASRLKVFLYDSGDEKPFTSGKYAMPEAIIEAAGGINVMESLDTSWGTTSWENVAVTEPDLIILLDYQNGAGAEELRSFLEKHPLMKQTPAVNNHRYLKLQYAELTPGPANIEAIEKLAHALYGENK